MRLEEDRIQKHIVKWVKWKYPHVIFTCAPATSKSAREGSQKKKMGYRPGWPDLFFAIAKQGYYGLFLELKTKDGKLAKNQKEILDHLIDFGYKAVVAYSVEEAEKIIENYLAL